jgi:AraC-like DNA-binding protein
MVRPAEQSPARRAGGLVDVFDVDVTVPYADENRNHVLTREWQRQGGEAVPPPPMQLPRHSEGAYRVRIRQQTLFDFLVEDQYSDAAGGRTGGSHRAEGRVAHLPPSGQWRFASPRGRFTVGPRQLMVRDNEIAWDFEIDRGTRSLVLQLPAGQARRALPGARAFVVGQDAPPARLLLGHLDAWAGIAGSLSPAAARAARAAGLELFRGLVADQVIDDEEFSAALAQAAMTCIDDRLADPDLDPAAIAKALHVSVRTLHRAFASQSATVMSYVQERRLDQARAELASSPVTVSEVAARWHFADSSHFSKSYRRRFGDSPAADRRRA